MTVIVDEKPVSVSGFVAVMQGWYEKDKGKLAALRRNAGNSLSEARGVTWFFNQTTRFAKISTEESLFLVATLFALDRKALTGGSFTGGFGRSMSVLKNNPGVNPEAIERRFAILLDATYNARDGEGDLPYRLRQIVKLALSKDVQIDWLQMLYDLQRWNHPDKFIQKAWARQFYTPFAPTETIAKETDEE